MVFGGACFGECVFEGSDSLGQGRNVLANGRQDVAGDVERPPFVLDLVEADDLGSIFDIFECLEPLDDLFAVFGVEEVLGAAFSEEALRIDDEHLVLSARLACCAGG